MELKCAAIALTPFCLVLVGFGLLWTRSRLHQQGRLTAADGRAQVLTALGWCLFVLGIAAGIAVAANMFGLILAPVAVVLLLGARHAESAIRSASLKRRSASIRSELKAHPDLANTQVYTPIEDWTNDDVWTFLMRFSNPWGSKGKWWAQRRAALDLERILWDKDRQVRGGKR